ncbi:hypothetical protein [Gaoshiqia sp. Z1-71]|uniref:hypothetical protein n=1 Tax=Gaoshiqia hydrogeniformans TaxID=3290090 RepID=UPI003BF7F8B9
MTNKTDIFDYVVIQPHYYFDETLPENLAGVRRCVSKQTICYRDGLTYGNGKNIETNHRPRNGTKLEGSPTK